MIQKSAYTLDKSPDQPVWSVHVDDKSIGKVGLVLEDTEFVPAPSVYVEFTDDSYAGGDIETGVIKEMIRYAYGNLPYAELYGRHLVSDTQHGTVLRKLGFEPDEKPYMDHNGQWQNVRLVL